MDWIPVTERLPEKDGRYLCTIQNKYAPEVVGVMVCDYWKQAIGYVSMHDWCPDDEAASDNVIAWAPLPAPYVNEEPPTDGCFGCKHRIIRSVPTSKFYCDLDDAFHDNLTNCPLEQDAPSASEIRGEMFYADMGDDE